MKENLFTPIRNPMTIIALFVGVIEIIIGVSIGAIPDQLKPIVIWFLVGFPILNALGFFIVLIFFPQKFYGPGDFQSDTAFLDSLSLSDSSASAHPALKDKPDKPSLPEASIDDSESTGDTDEGVS